MKKDYYYNTNAVNFSDSFHIRARCKKCKSSAKYVNVMSKPLLWVKPYHSKYYSNIKFNLNQPGWLDPGSITNASLFKSNFSNLFFNPKIHHSNEVPVSYTHMFSCECGLTTWSVNSSYYRPEIKNRKCKSAPVSQKLNLKKY